MEMILPLLIIGLLVIGAFAKEAYNARNREKEFVQSLYEDYGKIQRKEYASERMERMDSYAKRHPKQGQIDDITWNDLNMDEVFKRMNATLSATGEEYLYYTLRTPKQDEAELQHMEDLITFFMKHAQERVKIQLLLRKLGYTGKFSLYDYIDNLDYLGERSNKEHILMIVLMVVLAALIPIASTPAILGLVIVIIYNIMSYFKEQKEIDPYIISFGYIMRLIGVGEKVGRLDIPTLQEELNIIEHHAARLRSMGKGSFRVLSGTRGTTTGNPLDVLMDYVRMVFHVDLMKFNSMLSFLKEHIEEVDALVSTLGYLETCIAVGALRVSLTEGYCVPECREEEQELCLENGYHPLLTESVKNSIRSIRGVLLTGSNASGKSTFLKMVALNAIMAQTIHTCTAERYRAPFYDIYSSMALKDDLIGGESYYIVEIKALKRILDAAEQTNRKVLCFVDEVLRGTNTVERIAASTQILRSLSGGNILCFAATHDIELTDLLKDSYDNYHFEENICDGDISFPYKLLSGKATSRNAIRLLEIMGYEPEIIEKARMQAENFTTSGTWQLT